MAESLRVLIADDEMLARDRLSRQLDAIASVKKVGVASNGREAVEQARLLNPHVVLMDVRMPDIDGLGAASLLRQLPNPPAVIFTTAYREYAFPAFETHAAGYLLKPVRLEKLRAALQNVAHLSDTGASEHSEQRTHFCAAIGARRELIAIENIICLCADQKYTRAVHASGELLIADSLKRIEQEFPNRFIRVHRNALVSLHHIAGIHTVAGSTQVSMHGLTEKLLVSRRHIRDLRKLYVPTERRADT